MLPWRGSLITSRKIQAPSRSAIPRVSSITVPHRWTQTQDLSGVRGPCWACTALEDATLNRRNIIQKEKQNQWNKIGTNNTRTKIHTQTHRPVYIQTSLHGITVSHKPFYTQTSSHRDAFTDKQLHTDTQTLSHTDPCTQGQLYTQTLLHIDPLTHRPLHTQTPWDIDAFFAQTLFDT